MVEKIMLSDKEYEYLTKGIAIGVGIGIVSGMVLEDIVLGFSAGGVGASKGQFHLEFLETAAWSKEIRL